MVRQKVYLSNVVIVKEIFKAIISGRYKDLKGEYFFIFLHYTSPVDCD